MPERHWIIGHNTLTNEYRQFRWVEEWLPFKYCAMEDVQPDWQQVSLHESKEDAEQHLISLLN